MDLDMLMEFEKPSFNPLKHLGFKLKELANGGNPMVGSSGMRSIGGISGAERFGKISIRRFNQ